MEKKKKIIIGLVFIFAISVFGVAMFLIGNPLKNALLFKDAEKLEYIEVLKSEIITDYDGESSFLPKNYKIKKEGFSYELIDENSFKLCVNLNFSREVYDKKRKVIDLPSIYYSGIKNFKKGRNCFKYNVVKSNNSNYWKALFVE